VSGDTLADWPCPCCGYLVFSEPPGNYEICPVCGWEDDLSQLRFPREGGGANGFSLMEAQSAFASHEHANLGEPPHEVGYRREPRWRPLDPTRDAIERSVPGTNYGSTYATDPATYYYWRRR